MRLLVFTSSILSMPNREFNEPATAAAVSTDGLTILNRHISPSRGITTAHAPNLARGFERTGGNIGIALRAVGGFRTHAIYRPSVEIIEPTFQQVLPVHWQPVVIAGHFSSRYR